MTLMDRVFGTKTFVMEIYWQQRAFAIYERRTSDGSNIPNTVSVESLDGSAKFFGKHFIDISEAIRSVTN